MLGGGASPIPCPQGQKCLEFLGSESLSWLGRFLSTSREPQEMTLTDARGLAAPRGQGSFKPLTHLAWGPWAVGQAAARTEDWGHIQNQAWGPGPELVPGRPAGIYCLEQVEPEASYTFLFSGSGCAWLYCHLQGKSRGGSPCESPHT